MRRQFSHSASQKLEWGHQEMDCPQSREEGARVMGGGERSLKMCVFGRGGG